MAETQSFDTTDIVICGFGPTGAMLSTLLSQYSIPHVVLEKDTEVNVDPRGIALDEDGIRYLQACGLYSSIFTKIGQCMGSMNFIGGTDRDLSRDPFMSMDYHTTEGGTGHPGFMAHKQPEIERCLRSRINELGVADIRLGACVNHIREDDDWVYVSYTDQSGDQRTVRSRFLVGADGKTGFTRKNYLEPRGVALQRIAEASYEKDWVALNWKISLPTPETHPDFPLWAKGYTPQQVYDRFFPRNFRFLCNPDRPAVCGRFGMEADRLWRFEFVVHGGEDPQHMAAPEQIATVVHPYITHAGSRYGLAQKSIAYPMDCIEVLRCRPFRFSARSCNYWSLGRVVLCGDAAHVFPPFGGQGIASGFRDAISLAWRLRIATKASSLGSSKVNYRKLLEGWYSERKQQLNKSLASTVVNGEYVTQANAVKIIVRDWSLWMVQLIPSWRHTLRLGSRSEGLARYQWEDGKGIAFLAKRKGGSTFPQVYARSIGIPDGHDGEVVFTDDLIFTPEKIGLFQAVLIVSTVEKARELASAIQGLGLISDGNLREEEATILLDATKSPDSPSPGIGSIYRLATAGEFVADPDLCKGRPEPIGYDPRRIVKDIGVDKIVILRPDRFVFAVCKNQAEASDAA